MRARPLRSVLFSWGDRIAFTVGILLTVVLLAFFSHRMIRNVTRDRALGPVPESTPTPPPPPLPR